ncbi:hypothetical protein ACNKHX_07345 [Shigella flexneri]
MFSTPMTGKLVEKDHVSTTERAAAVRISITGWLWLDRWRDAEMLDLICPKDNRVQCSGDASDRYIGNAQPSTKEAQPTP